jgi:hypothetical protein
MLEDVGLIHVLLDDIGQVQDTTISNDIVPVCDTVTGNISNCPNCLFNCPHVWTSQKLNKQWNSSLVDNGLALNGGPRCDISQCPGSLELKLRVFSLLDILDHFGHQSGVNDWLDGRVVCYRQNLPDTNEAVMLS